MELLLCLLILLIFYYIFFHESMINYTIKDKQFKVYNKFDNYHNASELLYEIDKRINKLLYHLYNKYIIKPNNLPIILNINIEYLLDRYKYDNIKENFPISYIGYGKKPDSSYTLNKKIIAICLRHEKTKKLHDINDLMFVTLHELAHMGNKNNYGHKKPFWCFFKFLLHESEEIGIIQNINYHKNNIEYCNTTIHANPFFDKIPNCFV